MGHKGMKKRQNKAKKSRHAGCLANSLERKQKRYLDDLSRLHEGNKAPPPPNKGMKLSNVGA